MEKNATKNNKIKESYCQICTTIIYLVQNVTLGNILLGIHNIFIRALFMDS